MKVATQRSTPALRKQAAETFLRKSPKSPHTSSDAAESHHTLSDSLAICLFGFTRSMYVSEDEEEVRKRPLHGEQNGDEDDPRGEGDLP